MSTTDRQFSQDSFLPGGPSQSLSRDLTGVTLDDFHVQKLLGCGGMGEVYLATQISLNRPVALKVLKSDFALNPTYLGRLKTEATAVAKLNHANIVHVYTLGCVGDINFIAMEYVQGTNLKEYIVKKGALDLPLAYSIMRQTGQAIAAAGEVGLIHRDVKPENILMTRKGKVKVADFGLCRDSEEQSVHLTQSGVTMGTPLYMSPEQAQGHSVDHRSDLYSMGVTFYHMLTGMPPFRAETALALALKQVREAPRSMLVHRGELPPDLDKLVLKLMAKSPADRYQSAGEMLADLTRMRDQLQIAQAPTTIIDAGEPSGNALSALNKSAAPGRTAGSPLRLSAPTVLSQAAGLGTAASQMVSRLSGGLIAAITAACLVVGGVAGWTTREPDVMAVPSDAAAAMPALWVNPDWKAVAKSPSADEQFRYALLRAPRDEQVAAFLAVVGFFPHSHDQVSKAYAQLARIWYHDCNVDALQALEAELAAWKLAKTHDRELVEIVQIAIKLRKNDIDGVVKGLKSLSAGQISDMYDPALVELSLEICADAVASSVRSGTASIERETLLGVQSTLVSQLYRIEVPKNNRPQARPASKRP